MPRRALAIVGVRADEHALAVVVDDHLVEEAFPEPHSAQASLQV
jgi:hypothetical protein